MLEQNGCAHETSTEIAESLSAIRVSYWCQIDSFLTALDCLRKIFSLPFSLICHIYRRNENIIFEGIRMRKLISLGHTVAAVIYLT